MSDPKIQYEYGRTPEKTAPGILGFFNMLSGPLVDAFTPERREVITPSKTTYTEADGMHYPTTTPGVYGPVERGIEYMPVVQGPKSAYEFLEELISSGKKRSETADALVKGIGTLLEDQKRAGINAGWSGALHFYDPEQKRVVAYDPLLTPAMMGAAGLLAPVKGPGAVLGMFAGRNAATADLDALKVAEKMAAKGHSRDEIRDQTDWFRYNDRDGNPMGKWRFEVPDEASVAVTDPAALKLYLTETGRVKKGSGQTGYGPEIDKLLVHDELNKAYSGGRSMRPLAEIIRDISNINEATKKLQVQYGRGDLTEPVFREQYNLLLKQKSKLQDLMQKGLPIIEVPGGRAKTVREQYPLLDRPIGDTVMESTSTGARNLYGYYSPIRNAMAVRRDMGNTEQERIDAFRSTALHELQHAIQHREGFETGGTPREFGRGTGVDRPVNPKTGKKLTPFQTYRRLVGEAEARLVERRRDMTPSERRRRAPYDQLAESLLYTRKDLGVDRE